MSAFKFLLTSFAIGISVMALTWIHKLEHILCKCSQDYKKDYIKYFLYVYIIFLIFTLVDQYFVLDKSALYMLNIVRSLMTITLIINTIFAIMYIDGLKDCKCSEDIRRDIYYYMNIIYIAFVALAILIGILFYIMGMKLPKSAY